MSADSLGGLGWSMILNVAGSPSYTGKVHDWNDLLTEIRDSFNRMQGYKTNFDQKGEDANTHIQGSPDGQGGAEEPLEDSGETVVMPDNRRPEITCVAPLKAT